MTAGQGENDPAGMTVNERLFVAGLLKEFDDAFADGDRDEVLRILRRVDVDERAMLLILQQMGR